MTRRQTIGFDRKLDIEWLDAIAAMVAAGASHAEARTQLRGILGGSVDGKSKKGAMDKTLSVLGQLWSDVDADRTPLRDRACSLLPSWMPGSESPSTGAWPWPPTLCSPTSPVR